MDTLLALLIFVTGLALLAIPYAALWRWQGYWRALALLPAGALTFIAARIVIDTAADPTSHNLWPLELVVYNLPGLFFLAVLCIVRRFATEPAARWR